MQADIKDFLTGRGIEWEEVDDLAKVAGDVDVLYQTRIQKERFQVSFLGLLCLSFRCRLEARSTGNNTSRMTTCTHKNSWLCRPCSSRRIPRWLSAIAQKAGLAAPVSR